MAKKLVIVESPAKARTISGYLGPEFVVESSIGHIRDLPRNAADVPASHKGEKWARLGVDTENDFKALYIVPADKKKQVNKLKDLLKTVDELYLATDEDREGEAISWHLCELLKPKVPVRRLVFHEITKEAIEIASNGTDGIHVSFDLDGMDPTVAPGVGTAVNGGVSYRETHTMMEMIAETDKLVSLEVAEVNPILDVRNQTAEIAVAMVASAFGRRIL